MHRRLDVNAIEDGKKWHFKAPYEPFLKASQKAYDLGVKPNVLYTVGLKQAMVVEKKGKLKVRFFFQGKEELIPWKNQEPDIDQCLARFFNYLGFDLWENVNMFWDEGIYPSEHYE